LLARRPRRKVKELEGTFADLLRSIAFVLDVTAGRRHIVVTNEPGNVLQIERSGREQVRDHRTPVGGRAEPGGIDVDALSCLANRPVDVLT